MITKRSRAARTAAKVLLAAAVCGAATLGVNAPALADTTVNGCAQGWSTTPGTCIWVTTGGKNTGNHTQWVGQIIVSAPRDASSSFMEAWAGNGPSGVAWYQSGTGTYMTWNINQWIKTGSGICGSYTWPGTSDRSIACITITV